MRHAAADAIRRDRGLDFLSCDRRAERRRGAKLAEDLGYGTFWLGGSPQLSTVRPLLDATTSFVVATGVVNVWQNEPAAVAAEHAELTREFPRRLLLGIGVGHPEATSDYSRPLSTMREFLDGLDGADTPAPRDERCVATLGPKMLDLSARRSLRTHPYFTPVQHTRFARDQLGESALVAPELACVVDTDVDRARATARKYAAVYLGLRNYTSNLLKFGFAQEDITDGGSDRLIDAVIPHGTAEQIMEVAAPRGESVPGRGGGGGTRAQHAGGHRGEPGEPAGHVPELDRLIVGLSTEEPG